MQLWQSRRFKSNVFLHLKVFRSMSPIQVAVTTRLPLGRMEQGGTHITKPCTPVCKTTHIFHSEESLLNTEATWQGFHTSLLCLLFLLTCFLSCFLCPMLCPTAVSAGVESHSAVMLMTALNQSLSSPKQIFY